MALDIEKCKECYYSDEDGVCDKCCVDNAAFTPKRPNERICEWISVKDRLPEDGEQVVAAVKLFDGGLLENERTTITTYTERHRFEFYSRTNDSYLVTHWMPLPEPPKGE